jgi:hypothetical protein
MFNLATSIYLKLQSLPSYNRYFVPVNVTHIGK